MGPYAYDYGVPLLMENALEYEHEMHEEYAKHDTQELLKRLCHR